jgi:hypothetical protein
MESMAKAYLGSKEKRVNMHETEKQNYSRIKIPKPKHNNFMVSQ